MSITKIPAYRYDGKLYETEKLAELAKKANIEKKHKDELRWFIYDLAEPLCRGNTSINVEYLINQLSNKETRDKFKELMDKLWRC